MKETWAKDKYGLGDEVQGHGVCHTVMLEISVALARFD